MQILKNKWVRAALALGAALLPLTGCNSHSHSAGPGGTASGTVLRIGYQKGGSLNLLRLQGNLEKRLAKQGVTVQWLNFPAGPQLMEGLGANSIDIGSTGDIPPIFAQEAGVPMVYVANMPSSRSDGEGQAIIVPSNSPIHSVNDLKGKKVAFQKGSSAHYFIVQALNEAGLKYSDIQPTFLSPPDAQTAFSTGSIDAWAIWDPFLSIAETHTAARIIRDSAGLPTSGGFYLATRTFAVQHPELVKILLEEAKASGDWAQTHPHAAAVILAPNVGLDVATLEKIIHNGYTTSYLPINAPVIALQQKEADTFYEIGILPKAIVIKDDTLTPAQYALLAPSAILSAKAN